MKNKLARTVFLFSLLLGSNWLAFQSNLQWDLTEDQRYSISDATKSLLESMEEDVQVNVYLSGSFPPGFERLEAATHQTLEAFKKYSRGHVQFQFSDPSEANSESQRQQQYQSLIEQGLTPTNLFANEEGKRTEKIIFPGAIVHMDSLAIPVQLLKGNKASTSEEQLNQSYEGVEFELASAIRTLQNPVRKKVGLIVSHTLIPPARLSDLIASVQLQYDVFMDINNPESYEGLDALLILKPDSAFSDSELYKLDQYIVNGGNALFFTDGAKVDSVSLEGTYAQPLLLNLDPLFFKWGVRLNYDLVKDLNSSSILLNTGQMGEKPQLEPLPWRFYPLLNRFGDHVITRNLNAVSTHFLSTIDTVGGDANIRKTPLLMTSDYTQTLTTPALVGYNEARKQPEPREYQGGAKIAGILLEGTFTSLFQNRILPNDPRSKTFTAVGAPGRVIICSDGDMVVNDIDYKRNAPLPLGYDRLTGNTYGNKDFALLALDYLTDSQGLISARNKQVAIRPLDRIKVQEDRRGWQILNILAPLLLLAIFGAIRTVLRARKFT
ncbi:gliding-associated putative ABC transporter substrate-binding component GldG [Dyadobacter jejuensis]|uniref:Gliding-associated putative ABC transporter substrate-binding component GldG n=1 Tax=Dyadobacter jejuensis TaxID=1082580 RepID=A0A316AGF5_9BACT|nr:gliding motility-associated ABC transporter substrate-binding protein GldG [Dyadobacter jejuensis]PWJ56672.1 gliding-associated putative ABC transporter substrate-binding component GldG [Dyadobacter jejuensis]